MFQQRYRGPMSYPNNIHIRNQAFIHSYKPNSNLSQNQNEPRFYHFIPNPTSSTSSINSFPPGFPKHIYETAGHGGLDSNKGEIRTIYMSNVSSRCTERDIFRACSVFGKVENISLHVHRYRQDCQFGFVRYEKHDQAVIAIKRLQGTRRFWKPWRVDWAYKNSLDDIEKETANNNINNEDRQTRRKVVGVESAKMSKCLENSWVLVSRVPISVAMVQETLQKNGTKFEKIVKWSTFGVLVTGTSTEDDQTWLDHEVWLPNYFVKVFKFQHESTFLKKYVWVECIGIPVQAWDVVNMEKIVEAWGTLLALDLATACFHTADVARIFMETSCVSNIDCLIDFEFRDEIFKVKVKEMSLVEAKIDAICVVNCRKDVLGEGDAKSDQTPECALSVKLPCEPIITSSVNGTLEDVPANVGATIVMDTPQTPVTMPGVDKLCTRCDKDMGIHEHGELCQNCVNYKKGKQVRNVELDNLSIADEELSVDSSQVTPEQLLPSRPQCQHIRFLDLSEEQVTPLNGQMKESEAQNENFGRTVQALNFDSPACEHSCKGKTGADRGNKACDCVQKHKKRRELFFKEQEKKKGELEKKLEASVQQNIQESTKKSRGRPKGSKNKNKKRREKEKAECSKKGATSIQKKGPGLQDDDDLEIDTNLDEDLQDGIEVIEELGLNMNNDLISKYADFIGA